MLISKSIRRVIYSTFISTPFRFMYLWNQITPECIRHKTIIMSYDYHGEDGIITDDFIINKHCTISGQFRIFQTEGFFFRFLKFGYLPEIDFLKLFDHLVLHEKLIKYKFIKHINFHRKYIKVLNADESYSMAKNYILSLDKSLDVDFIIDKVFNLNKNLLNEIRNGFEYSYNVYGIKLKDIGYDGHCEFCGNLCDNNYLFHQYLRTDGHRWYNERHEIVNRKDLGTKWIKECAIK